ncbi:hydroxyacylglutathione hydrolase family protein [Geopsychrobacter electrodiphilus]|uniref:hydroxyacylglutathione hydrolase family protein n=1 Tax=Geopsychrobacter electrodiphilus TaxID=225196 RepID=UPI000369FBDC|nr:hydroxyacylglutathione hydrolase family protein [Geopsychrobacter electrodiphilus]
MLEVLQIPAGPMDNFAYLVFCPQTRRAVVVDPSFAPQVVLAAAYERQLQIVGLLNTHGHHDHIAGNDEILAAVMVPHWGHPFDLPAAKEALLEGTIVPVGEGGIRVMHTPGHTPGSVVLHTGEGLITGDTLFVGRCGRADLPGSDVNKLYDSLQRIKLLDGALKVYPGHNYGARPISTIADERRENNFLSAPDREAFIHLRMG